MIKSMTGFGKHEAALQNKKITVEVRSLNSKQLDLNLRLPGAYRQAEYEIRTRVGRLLQRGKVDLFITAESAAAETSAHINRAAFNTYYKQLSDLCMENGAVDVLGNTVSAALIQSVLRMPDVVSTEEISIPDDELNTLLDTVEQAAQKLDAFRQQEGAILIADLLCRVALIEQYMHEVVPFEKPRTEAVRTRILDNLAQLNAEVDRNRLEQEMIFYLEKLDITEEKVRLANHCNYFREVAAEEQGAGRKLGFIAQEMGREINTMGSKANEANIQRLVIKMKDELEKIKEQVLNIL